MALVAIAAALSVQIVPLPAAALQWIDPNAESLREALSGTAAVPRSAMLPISILPGHTVAAIALFLMAALMFRACLRLSETSGPGRLIRAIAVMGIAASMAAIIQRSASRELLYGFWRPLDAGARPYGPFVNRNHFATWAGMACPLVLGYLLARAPASGAARRPWTQRIADAAKQFGSMRAWLTGSVCALAVAVALSASRSGIIGLATALAVSLLMAKRQNGPSRYWLMLQAGLLVVALVSFANFDAIAGRLNETMTIASADRGRSAVWRDTIRVIEDFRFTGTGAGTFAAAIIPYQKAEPGYSIGQAHNHYLQLLAEGGVLVAAPAAAAAVSFLLLFRRRLKEEKGPDLLIRAGAISGMAGVIVQSIWETGLRMPANALLFSVLAAIAVHAPPQRMDRH
jgi:O-antigen ligase